MFYTNNFIFCIFIPILFIVSILLSFFKILEWSGWQAITAIVIAYFTYRQTKYLNYTTRPIAWFMLVSPKTLNRTDGKTVLLVHSESKFKIFFYIHITLKSGDKIRTQAHYWKDGDTLHIYPPGMHYPDVMGTMNEFTEEERRSLIAEIKYAMAPSHAPSEIYDAPAETWKFNGETWSGPNGMPDTAALATL